jgi:hypothetical protein
VFEAACKAARQIPAAFDLTPFATMLIKGAAEGPSGLFQEKTVLHAIATTLILVGRRTAGGG